MSFNDKGLSRKDKIGDNFKKKGKRLSPKHRKMTITAMCNIVS